MGESDPLSTVKPPKGTAEHSFPSGLLKQFNLSLFRHRHCSVGTPSPPSAFLPMQVRPLNTIVTFVGLREAVEVVEVSQIGGSDPLSKESGPSSVLGGPSSVLWWSK